MDKTMNEVIQKLISTRTMIDQRRSDVENLEDEFQKLRTDMAASLGGFGFERAKAIGEDGQEYLVYINANKLCWMKL